jgi:hypothetical protein
MKTFSQIQQFSIELSLRWSYALCITLSDLEMAFYSQQYQLDFRQL